MTQDINIGAISEALNNKVDLNCNNIDNNGEKHFDGQWVVKLQTLSNATAVGTYEIDLSEYLPNDGYDYEVSFGSSAYSSLDTVSNIQIKTDVFGEDFFSINAVNGASRRSCNTFTLPVRKKITYIISSGKAEFTNLGVHGYRRIGTNN